MVIAQLDLESPISVRSFSAAEAVDSVEVFEADEVITGGTTTEEAQDDCLYEVTSAATVDRNIRVASHVSASLENLTPEIVDLDPETGMATRITDGTARILVKNRFGDVVASHPVVRESGSTSAFKEFVSGSLAHHLSDQIDSRLMGHTASDRDMFSVRINSGAGSYVWNTSCWAASIDMTAVNAWYGSQHSMTGIAITPKHMLFCYHWGPSPSNENAYLRFVTPENEVVLRDVTARYDLGHVGGTDLRVVQLAEDLPVSIKPVKLMPAHYTDYFTRIGTLGGNVTKPPIGLPAIQFDQFKRAKVNEFYSVDWGRAFSSVHTYSTFMTTYGPIALNRQPFYSEPVINDSSSPICAVLNGELVLIGVTQTKSSGMNVSNFIPQINAAIEYMSPGGGYEVEEADLSGFPKYYGE